MKKQGTDVVTSQIMNIMKVAGDGAELSVKDVKVCRTSDDTSVIENPGSVIGAIYIDRGRAACNREKQDPPRIPSIQCCSRVM